MPDNDVSRLEALHRYRIVDTPSEDSFDGIAKLATQIFNVPISLLSLVDAESVFFKANVGMGKAKEANSSTNRLLAENEMKPLKTISENSCNS